MTAESFWGDVTESDVVPPVTLLREAAAQLAKATKGILEGRVQQVRGTKTGVLAFTLWIVAPALDNYAYEVLRVAHGFEMYPASVARFAPDPADYSVRNDEELRRVLQQILSSDEVRRVVTSLLQQSKALA